MFWYISSISSSSSSSSFVISTQTSPVVWTTSTCFRVDVYFSQFFFVTHNVVLVTVLTKRFRSLFRSRHVTRHDRTLEIVQLIYGDLFVVRKNVHTHDKYFRFVSVSVFGVGVRV